METRNIAPLHSRAVVETARQTRGAFRARKWPRVYLSMITGSETRNRRRISEPRRGLNPRIRTGTATSLISVCSRTVLNLCRIKSLSRSSEHRNLGQFGSSRAPLSIQDLFQSSLLFHASTSNPRILGRRIALERPALDRCIAQIRKVPGRGARDPMGQEEEVRKTGMEKGSVALEFEARC